VVEYKVVYILYVSCVGLWVCLCLWGRNGVVMLGACIGMAFGGVNYLVLLINLIN
jgi:hypothetical protein